MRWSRYVARIGNKYIRSFGEKSSRRETTFNTTYTDLKKIGWMIVNWIYLVLVRY
jgi:hypothetical protein